MNKTLDFTVLAPFVGTKENDQLRFFSSSALFLLRNEQKSKWSESQFSHVARNCFPHSFAINIWLNILFLN